MGTLEDLGVSIKKGKRKDAKRLTQEAVDAGTSPQEILDALTVSMDEIGVRFRANEIFVPEVLIAARSMKMAMEVLEPVLLSAGIEPEHKVIVGTVKGDLHDIGKNLVVMMLKGANFEVIDLGIDVPAEKFVETAKAEGVDIVCLSALLTTTMPAMKEAIEAAKGEGLSTKFMVGGAPVTQEFADEIGADGYAADAASAVEVARKLLSA